MAYILEMRNITKQFPGVLANDNCNLLVEKGSIHALMGENGAEVVTDEAVNGSQYTVSVRLNAPDESPLQRGFGRLRLERRPQ